MKRAAVVVLAYVLMGAVFGWVMVYSPLSDEAHPTWRAAVALGSFFTVVVGLFDLVVPRRRKGKR